MVSIEEYFPFWKKLTKQQQDRLKNATHEVVYDVGTQIEGSADHCIGLMLVIEGRLRVYTVSSEGKVLTLFRLFERELCLLTASCMLPGIDFDVMVAVEDTTRVLHISADAYREVMRESAVVANYTNEVISNCLSDVVWLLDQILNKKLDSRISAFLVEESQIQESLSLSITHEQIGNFLGSPREVVSRLLNYLQKAGYLSLGRGTVKILDIEALEKIAEGSQ